MNILLIVLSCIAALFVFLYIVFWIKSITPSPIFKPTEYEPVVPDYWPTKGFRNSTAEEQGMSSAKLLRVHTFYQKAHKKNPNVSIDSIAVYRNGYLVADYYFNPLFPRDTMHIIHSVTKSIMSSLVGIAIDKGYIESVDVPFIDFFKDKHISITDEGMRKVTLKDLLSMQTGIRSRDSVMYQWEGLFAMQETDDWVSFIMSLPIDVEPGIRFDYSNMSSFLLSAIIQETTGKDTLTFGRENLFNRIGIGQVRWEWSPQGYGIGYARMWMKPEDMAKFGLLYLQKGYWDGKQIVPTEWVKESITPNAFPKNVVDMLDASGNKDKKLTTSNWRAANFFRSFADGYGYQWWLDKDGSYSAVGVGGQYIMVVPKKNLMVVVTNSSSRLGVFFPRKILDKYILPAIVSNKAVAQNKPAYNELIDRSGPPELITIPNPTPILPETAMEISGKTYSLEKNNFKYDNFQLIFDPSQNHALFSYVAKEEESASFQIGLDGVYRFSDTNIGQFAAYGSWISQNTFDFTFIQIGYSTETKFILTFEGNSITVEEFGVVGEAKYSGKAKE